MQHEPSALHVASDQTDPQSYDKDLDLFGQYSLFYLINRTGFITGEQKLVQLLKAIHLEQMRSYVLKNR